MSLFLLLAGWLVLLVVATEACRRAPPIVMVGFWLLVPLALLPSWLNIAEQAGWTWFLWAKTYSVTTAIVWLSVCRAWHHQLPTAAIQWTLYLFLGLNIFEAAAKDLSTGNALNAVAGALLVATMGWPSGVSVEPEGRHDLVFSLGGLWVLAYTVWNATFVYCNWSALVWGQHMAVLGAALVLGATSGWDRWFQARTFTLGLHIIAYDTFFFQIRKVSGTSALYSETVSTGLQVVSLVVVATLLAVDVYRKRTDGATS